MEQIVTAVLSLLGGAVGMKGLDALRERWKAGDVRESRDDAELAEVRKEYRADNAALRDDLRDLQRELVKVKDELAQTRVELARALDKHAVQESMYTQLVQAHTDVKRERDELKIDLAVRNAEILDLHKLLGLARDELQVLKGLPAPPAKGDGA